MDSSRKQGTGVSKSPGNNAGSATTPGSGHRPPPLSGQKRGGKVPQTSGQLPVNPGGQVAPPVGQIAPPSGATSETAAGPHQMPCAVSGEDVCAAALRQYGQNLQAVCGASSHAAEMFAALLVGSPYAGIAAQVRDMYKDIGIYSHQETLKLLERTGSLWKYLPELKQQEKGTKEEQNKLEQEFVAGSMKYFLQSQLQLFYVVTERMAILVKELSGEEPTTPTTPTPSSQPPTLKPPPNQPASTVDDTAKGSSPRSGTQVVRSSSPIHKLGMLFSQLGGGLGEEGEGGVLAGQDNTRVVAPAGQDKQTSEVTMATEEDLDNVIDLLSQGHKQQPVSMTTIPELSTQHLPNKPMYYYSSQPPPNFPAYPPPELLVGADILNQSPYGVSLTQKPTHMGQRSDSSTQLGQRSDAHRRSEGQIDDPLLSGKPTKTNTWPFRPGHKSGLGDLAQLSQFTGSFDAGNDPEYNRYLNSLMGMGRGSSGPSYGGLNGWSNPWNPTDSKGWPPFANVRSESSDLGASKQWSTTVDSSSCSDESSSNNNDIDWMMGSDLMKAVNERRRHSSGEDNISQQAAQMLPLPAKALDDLMEPKSTNTWPPKQLFFGGSKPSPMSHANTNEGFAHGAIGEKVSSSTAHRQVTPQWSDPLNNKKTLSLWEPNPSDIRGSVSQQNLRPGGL